MPRLPHHRRAAERRLLAGQGMHTVHIQFGRRDPDCPLCPKGELVAVSPAPSGLGQSWAERHQPDVTAADHRLTEQARLGRPAVRWWWGERRDGATNGAYCYLCGAFCATWDHRWPMPARAGAEVVDHRDQVHGLAAQL